MSTPAWLTPYRVTDDWDDHRNRGSLGGVDWATPVGTPIYATSDGVLDFRFFPDRSSVLRVRRSDGTATEFLHGTLYGANKRLVTEGTLIGHTDGRRGTPGAGPSSGPHLHVHDVNASGVRVPPFTTGTVRPASVKPTPVEVEDEIEEEMSSILYQSNVKDAEVVYELDTVTKTTRIIGKSTGSLGYLGAAPILTGRKVYTINAAQVADLITFYPTEPVPAALYAKLSGNVPAILGLRSA